jgi:hypothetical protein
MPLIIPDRRLGIIHNSLPLQEDLTDNQYFTILAIVILFIQIFSPIVILNLHL